jgi:uncharacterized protein (TIGR03435 family)
MRTVIGLFLICGPAILAQATDAPMQFDVASIKVTAPGTRGFRFAALPGGRLDVRNNTLQNIMVNAFDVRIFQLAGLPTWGTSDNFDIDARVAGNPTRLQMMQMLQALLADRFHLKTHRETRELPIFVMTAAKGGVKLESSKDGGCVVVEPGQPVPRREPGQAISRICGNNIVRPAGTNMQWNAYKINMPGMIQVLSNLIGERIVDHTGFTAAFDLNLEWTPTPGSADPTEDHAGDAAGLSLAGALLRDAGLKLERSRGPVEVLVIDHVERPTEN